MPSSPSHAGRSLEATGPRLGRSEFVRRDASRSRRALLVSVLLPLVLGCGSGAAIPEASGLRARGRLEFTRFDEGLPRSGQWRNGFAIADIDGDGALDLIHGPARKGRRVPVVFRGDGGGTWTPWREARFPDLPYDYGDVAAADFDGNGTIDLALAAHLRGVVVLLHDGRGGFRADPGGPRLETGESSFSSRALAAVDWNSDGGPDLAVLSEGPRPLRGARPSELGLRIYLNAVPAWRTILPTEEDRAFGDHLAVGDVNGDGRPDALVSSNSLGDRDLLRLGTGDGWIASRVAETAGRGWVPAVALADFDGDGKDEMILGSQALTVDDRSARIVVNGFEGGAPVEVARLESEPWTAVAAGDVDGDGAMDLVAGSDSGRIRIFFGGPGRRFTPGADVEAGDPSGCRVYGLAVADLDGDGAGEIVASLAGETSAFAGGASCSAGGGISIWRLAISRAAATMVE